MVPSQDKSFAPAIDVGDPDDLAYWVARLGTTPQDLVRLVEDVGDNPRAVATELGVPLID